MISLAVSTYCLAPCTLEEALSQLAEIGYRKVEIPVFCHGEEDEAICLDAKRLSQFLSRYGLSLAALYPRPISIHSAEALAQTIKSVEDCIGVALELGCGRIVFSPLLPRETYPYPELVEAVLRCARKAEGTPLRICLENHANWPLSSAADYRQCAALWNHPNIGITLDTGHFTALGQDILAFYEEFRASIHHIHLKDHIGPHSVPLGKGTTENVALFERLHRAGFNGIATVEIEVEDTDNRLRYLADALHYAKTVLGITH